MGQSVSIAQGTTSFVLVMYKDEHGNMVVTANDVSGTSKVSKMTLHTDSNKFTIGWDNSVEYSRIRTGIIYCSTAITESYTQSVNYLMNNYIIYPVYIGKTELQLEIKYSGPLLFPSVPTWSEIFNSVSIGVKFSSNITVSTSGPSKISKVDKTYYTFNSMLSPANISNGNVYVNQDGNSVYLSNDTINIDVIKASYTDLSNDDGEYMSTVTIGPDRNVTWTKDYMDFIDSYSWIDDSTILLKMDIGSHTGGYMINTDYNEIPIGNYPIRLEKTDEGIVCHGVNEGMQFTMLITITG